MKTGIANLPLHGGSCPRWLFPRMKKLSGRIAEIIIDEYGADEFLRRMADPFFLQSFGSVIGFDWHSSGLTTTTLGALKSAQLESLGIQIAGGKGKVSRKALDEIESTTFSMSSQKIERLKYSSRIAAKVDSSLVQDNYQLYHHCFIFSEKGSWAVVQQGMNSINKYARRYHWLSENIHDFVEEPHSGIDGKKEGNVLNLTAKESSETRKASVDLVNDNPIHLIKHFNGQTTLHDFFNPKHRILDMHSHHPIYKHDLNERTIQTLKKAYEIQPQNYEELIAIQGVGAKTVRALALISELIYGTKPSWEDPVKYSFAHGGKDGYPFPIERKQYDKTIAILKEAVQEAKILEKDKISSLKKLNQIMTFSNTKI